MSEQPTDIATHPIHLGLGATAQREPEFTGEMSWYAGYGERHGDDGIEGRLVAMHTFTQSWDSWEMTAAVTLGPGQYVIDDPGPFVDGRRDRWSRVSSTAVDSSRGCQPDLTRLA